LLRNKKVYKNSSVELQVEIDTSYTDEFTFKWKKNNELLDIEDNKDKYKFTNEGTKYKLGINNFTESDEGYYEIFLAEPSHIHFVSKARVELAMGKFDEKYSFNHL